MMNIPLRIALLVSAALHLGLIVSVVLPLNHRVPLPGNSSSDTVRISLRQSTLPASAEAPLPEPGSTKRGDVDKTPVGSVPDPAPAPLSGQRAEADSPPESQAIEARTPDVADASPGPAPKPPVLSPAARQRYLEQLVVRIRQNKFYPSACRRLGEQGRVVIGFVIQRDGRLADIRVVQSSGYQRLDNAARQAVERASPTSPLPASFPSNNWPVQVPVDFSLR